MMIDNINDNDYIEVIKHKDIGILKNEIFFGKEIYDSRQLRVDFS